MKREKEMLNQLDPRWRRAAWLVLAVGFLAWAAVQPPGALEPLPWVGTLDI